MTYTIEMNQFIQEALHDFHAGFLIFSYFFIHSAQLQYTHVLFRKTPKKCLNISSIITSENKRF